MADSSTLLTLREAAARLRVSVRTVERECADGRLAIVRVRSRRLIDPAELDRYIAASQVIACPSAEKATAGRSVLALESEARALSSVYPKAQRAPTRSRSKLRSGAARSRLQLVAFDV